MKYKILISAPYMQPVVDIFKQIFEDNKIEIIVPKVRERMSEKELLEVIDDIDGVISGDDQFTEKVLKKAKKLKVISKWGTGIDSIDKDACKKHGVKICNTPNAFTEPVADSILGYILCFARKQPWQTQELQTGTWEKIPCVAMNESTLGIIGLGNIGKAVARRAKPFGINILGNDIVDVPDEFIKETGARIKSKEEVLSESDFISLNCDLNQTSKHLISTKELNMMKPTAVIINTARGPIIDEKALVYALENNQIAGACLDVFEDEPLPLDSPLRSMDNVLLAAHNSNSSPKAWEKVHENTINNLLNALKQDK